MWSYFKSTLRTSMCPWREARWIELGGRREGGDRREGGEIGERRKWDKE